MVSAGSKSALRPHGEFMPNDLDPQLMPTGVRIEKRNALGLITLDRPAALNALDGSMRAAIAAALPDFATGPLTYAVVIQSASPKAFCAGGDVRKILACYREDKEKARRLFAEEYRLIWALECFSRPTASLIDGLVMGSGVGLSGFNTHQVAGEKYRFAMPETSIGLFPDVGAAHVLARLPHEIGTYLGLTGRVIGRADAYALGLVTHCLPASRFAEVIDSLIEAWPIDPLLDDRHEDPGESELMGRGEIIERCFSPSSVSEILARLADVRGSQAEWASGVRDDLLARAPLSLAVSLRHIREARDCGVRETLTRDYRLACRFLEGHDFSEGVRAMLVDKDKAPHWQPPSIAEIDLASVERYFAPLAEGELELQTREQMQALP